MRFLFLHQGCAFAQALAQVGELGAPGAAFALDFHPLDAGRMDGKNALDAFAVADAPDGEHLVEPVAAPSDDDPGKDLDAFFVAFDDLGMHAHRIANREFGRLFAKLFRFDFIK